ncbi:MAG: ABC transporter permease [Kibdelosporangium sp.]
MSLDNALLPAALPQPRARDKVRIVFGVAVLLLLVLVVAVPDLFAAYAPAATDLTNTLRTPSAEHLFGTDQLGRDVFSRVIHGTRISMIVAVGATVLAVSGGAILGLLAAYAGRWLDAVLMRLVDVLLAFPELLMALLVVAILGGGSVNVGVAIGFAGVATYARLIRGQARLILRSEYVESARTLGVPPRRYLLRHVLPNISGPLVVLASIGSGSAIIAGAGLSVLGLGAKPPAVDWGSMIAEGKDYLQDAWWISVFPGLVVVLVVVAVTMVGRSLQASAVR